MKPLKSKNSLTALLVAILVMTLIPLCLLSYFLNRYMTMQAYQEVKSQAAAITDFTNDRLRELIRSEDLRPFTEYSLNSVEEIGISYFLSVSPLARVKPSTSVPGVKAYFQIESNGRFSTPLWPKRDYREEFDIDQPSARKKKLLEIYDTLKSSEPLVNAESSEKGGLSFYRYQKKLYLENEDRLRDPGTKPLPKKKSKSFQLLDLRSKRVSKKNSKKSKGLRQPKFSIEQVRKQIRIKGLDAIVNPFEATVLDTGNIVFFRDVQVGKKKFLQGFLVEEKEFFSSILNPKYRKGLSEDLQDQIVVASGEKILPSFTEAEKYKSQQILVLKTSLPAPLQGLQMFYSTGEIRLSASWVLFNGALLAIFLVLVVGSVWLFFIGKRQMELVQRQSNFVSAVSHELRTPLTAIRMHSEMLQSDWVGDEERKKKAYGFILNESERLSRLINNVLSMARIGRDQLELQLQHYSLKELESLLKSRLGPLAENSGFKLVIQNQVANPDLLINVDKDALLQIFLNLVDNAIKFAKESELKTVELKIVTVGERVVFSVRDYGPGIPPASRSRLFELFFRAENEMTRSTTGTGIGLALVQQLAIKMGAEVKLDPVDQGAQFSVSFPVAN
jgi:signal transduction histidine kinase